MDRTQDFWNQQAEWSRATFGSDTERGPLGPLKHLEKEAKEAQTEVEKLARKEWPSEKDTLYLKEEIADCLFLTFDAARRTGISLDDLLDTAFQKLEINKAREWPKNLPLDSAIEHVRSDA